MNDQLIEILAQSVVQGRFYATGKRSLLDLGLEVKGVGAIRTPVAPGRAKQIIKQCRQAPYGLGHKTLVDTCVRNVWELGPRKFKIHSPQWKHQLADLVEEVGKQLGLADQKIKAQLYKMLIYEKGSFFVPHQDTEKTDAMFATMVVVLPSRHSGGALVISHNGEDKKLFFGGKNSDATIQYAGFYADCRHEVKPITDGYRVCLVYNLSLPKKVSIPLTPQNRTAQKKVAELLQEWSKKSEQPEKKSILFDHQYTSAELSLKNLKSKDFVTGEILSQAAQEAQCEVHLALLAFHQSGTPSGGYDDYDRYYRSRRGYYSRYYEDEEDEDDKYIDSGAVMEDIFEEDLSVTQWFTLGGQKKEMGFIPISTDDVIASIDFEDKDPDESQYEGYMGNYGPSLDRWYHRAALVVWPKKYKYSILVQAGPTASVSELSSLTKKMRQAKHREKATLLQECQSFAHAIIAHGKFESTEKNKPIASMLKLIPDLQDDVLAKDFLQTIFSRSLYGDEGKSLVVFLDAIGWKNVEQELMAVFEQSTQSACKMVQLLEGMYTSLAENKNTKSTQSTTQKLSILKSLADRLANNIESWDKTSRDHYYFGYGDSANKTYMERIELIISLIERCFSLFKIQALNSLVQYFANTEKHYPLHGVLIPILEHYGKSADQIDQTNPAVKYLISLILTTLKNHTEKPIQIPRHWKMKADWQCECKDCLMLKEFLHDAKEKTLQVKMGKERRKHMHRTIDQHVIDLSHETIRQGSPFTLVFEKNRKSFEQKEKIWQKELTIFNEYNLMLDFVNI